MLSSLFRRGQKSDSPKLKVYLLDGPDALMSNPSEIRRQKKRFVDGLEYIGIYANTANKDLMDQCQVILVNVALFPDNSMDRSTAFAMGYLDGKSAFFPSEVLIVGYGDQDNRDLRFASAIRITGGEIFDSFEQAAQNIKRLWDQKQGAACDTQVLSQSHECAP